MPVNTPLSFDCRPAQPFSCPLYIFQSEMELMWLQKDSTTQDDFSYSNFSSLKVKDVLPVFPCVRESGAYCYVLRINLSFLIIIMCETGCRNV